MKVLNFIVVFLFLMINQLPAGEDCKTRLPKTVNNYSPVIVPLITFDGNYLYFDRKEHPENTGGIKDVDEIWFSEKKMGRFWSEPKKVESWINTENPNVIFNITPDGRKALIYGGFKNERKGGFSIVDRAGNEFTNPQPLLIDAYENKSGNFYATLSIDMKTMIISLKNDDCFGGEDLFVSFLIDGNKWSKPKNLGNQINTLSDETSPVIAFDGATLYYASNTQGYGDFDLYMSKRLDNTWQNWSEPVNLGKTINSKFKETGFSLTSLSDSAYIISSEFQVLKSADKDKFFDSLDLRHGIYTVCIPEELRPENYLILKGIVSCKDINELSPVIDTLNFNVQLNSDFHNDFIYSTFSENGSYLFICPNNVVANISIKVSDFPEQKFVVRTDTITSIRIYEKNFEFQKAKESIPSKVENLNYTFYFDFDDYHLNTQQISELKQFLNTLNNGNKIQFVITGHTDSVGTEIYNKNLSLKRANEVGKQLHKLGINKHRISIIAKSNAEPLGIDDSKNRRVEIKAIIEE